MKDTKKDAFIKPSEIIFKILFIVLSGLIIYYADNAGIWGDIFTKLIILALALFKTCFFIVQSINKIKESTVKHLPYYQFLIFIAINIMLLIPSFGMDYFILNEALPDSFVGVNNAISGTRRFFDFVYFSSLNMTNFGFGTLMPASMVSKALTSIEVVLSFVIIIFVLSDFMSLKDSIKKKED